MTILNKKYTHKGGVVYKAYVVINGEIKFMNINSNSSNNGNNQSLSGEIINSNGNDGGGGASKLIKVEKKNIINEELYNEIYKYLYNLKINDLKINDLQNNLSDDIKVKLIDIDRESLQIILNNIFKKIKYKKINIDNNNLSKYVKEINITFKNKYDTLEKKNKNELETIYEDASTFYNEQIILKKNAEFLSKSNNKKKKYKYIEIINKITDFVNDFKINYELITKDTIMMYEDIFKKLNYISSKNIILYNINYIKCYKINILSYIKNNIIEQIDKIWMYFYNIYFTYQTLEMQKWGLILYQKLIDILINFTQ
jgi:hypothetical protein